MKKTALLLFAFAVLPLSAQTNPAIISWIQNTTGITGRHYVSGNPTPIQDNVSANVQSVEYSDNWVYIHATGIPAYITGPFIGNPSVASNQNAIYKFPLNPTQNTGTPSNTTGGNIGVFINGVSLFDFRDAVAWNTTNSTLCGGPMNPPCPGGPQAIQAWNRDAIPAEKNGFDCAKAHPANGNYHHHQNPSAFNLDLVVISTICDTYPADGLYVINTQEHSPLLGFAYDGFPVYGAYGYTDTDGSGGISRMKSGYQLRNITQRTHHADGTDVADGPAVNSTYFLGYFREDYEYIAHPGDKTYLDEHNGRFCITPEYPNGIYAYFCTVDENHNSAYPYAVGPTFYGNVTAAKVNSITEPTTVYTPAMAIREPGANGLKVIIYPNPASDFIAIQAPMVKDYARKAELINELGQSIKSAEIMPGSTLCTIETDTVYNGVYFIKVTGGKESRSYKVIINR